MSDTISQCPKNKQKPFPKNKNPKNLLKTFRKTRELLLFNKLQDNLAHSETGGAQWGHETSVVLGLYGQVSEESAR